MLKRTKHQRQLKAANKMVKHDDDAGGSDALRRAAKLASGEPLSALQRATRDLALPEVHRLMRDHLDSPLQRAMRGDYDSPLAKLTRQTATLNIHNPVSPGLSELARQAAGVHSALSAQNAELGALNIHSARVAALAPNMASLSGAVAGVRTLHANADLATAIHGVHSALDAAMRPFGGAATAVAALGLRDSERQTALLEALGGSASSIARASQWASVLHAAAPSAISDAFGQRLVEAVQGLRGTIATSWVNDAAQEQQRLSAVLGLGDRLGPVLSATHLKMSALAGFSDLHGIAAFQRDAYHSLFGAWRTRPDLPESFWRDDDVRLRMYREAEVDDGLVISTPDVALEVMIESGLTAGMRSDGDAIAIVTLGDVSMMIRSRDTRKDAYAVLELFELELRAYISRKLEERYGPKWFQLRASQLIGKAKSIRKAAVERGEKITPLIDFVEMGELASIILSKSNWDDVFGDMFINHAAFDHDMQKLIAARRPTMHIRSVDGVRLVELVCVIQRLSEQMADDGAWKVAVESDE